jgi:AraC-like DNA-binding protein
VAYYAVLVPRAVVPFRVHTVKETADVSLTRFDHPAGANLPDSEEQATDRFQINIVERGAFRLGHEGREWLLGSGCVFLSRPNDMYRYAHLPDLEPDTCLSLNLSRSLPDELSETLMSLPLVPQITNRLRFLQLELGTIIRDDPPLKLQTLACQFVEAVAEASSSKRRLYRRSQLQWYAERIHVAREKMDANPADQHSLSHLSSQVAMSPFLFARVFREMIGLPPHKYLLQLRLARARTLLESGMSVTNTCYAAGFNNLSHFIRMFRRHFGLVPSAMKHLPGGTRSKEMSGGAMGKIPPHAQRFIWEQNGGTGWGQNPKRNPRYNRYN